MSSSLFPHFSPITNGAAPGGAVDILPTDFLGGAGSEKGLREAVLQITPTNATVVNLIERPTERGGFVKATAQIQAVTGAELVDGDDFTLRNDRNATKNFEVEKTVAATGEIQAVGKDDLVDGETFTLDDGVNPAVVFEFDKTGNGVGGGNEAVDISGPMPTVEDIAIAIMDAINAAAALDITAQLDDADPTKIVLLNDLPGTVGNTSSAETVTDAGFTVSDMTGGLGTDGVAGGSVALTIPDAWTAAEVAAYLVEKINEAAQRYVASVNEDDPTKVDLVQQVAGTAGNGNNAEAVADATFTVSNFAGGTGAATTHKLNAGAQIAAASRYSERLLLNADKDYNVQVVTDGIVIGLAVASFR